MLKIENLRASIGRKEILKGIDLEVGSGEIHVLMGPNGSGKSTLAQVIAGSPQFTVHSSQFTVAGKDLSKLTPDKRAKLGIFLGFQNPVEVPGVSVFSFLRKAKQSNSSLSLRSGGSRRSNLKLKKIASSMTPRNKRAYYSQTRNDIVSVSQFRQELLEYASSLKLSGDFLRRSLNEGFSGGEKKRNEILQMMVLCPKLAILDEIDSGLDVDGLKVVTSALIRFKKQNPRSSVLLITHYARILKYIKPDFVHVMVEGKIVKSGKMNLAKKIEEKGYQSLQKVIASEAKQSNLSS